MLPTAAPFIVRMPVSKGGVFITKYYPYPALFLFNFLTLKLQISSVLRLMYDAFLFADIDESKLIFTN